MSEPRSRIRLLFADGGAFHHEEVELPTRVVESYERLLDCFQEDPEVLRRMHVDLRRLCAAWVLEEDETAGA